MNLNQSCFFYIMPLKVWTEYNFKEYDYLNKYDEAWMLSKLGL